MYASADDLKTFYSSRIGRVVRRVLQDRILDFWGEEGCNDLRVMGTGYAVPYLNRLKGNPERCFAIMPAGQGAHKWPLNAASGVKNLVCLSSHADLPIETNSIDRILMIHDMEHCDETEQYLHDIWRVLKSGGRLLMIVPSRSGLWAHADWSPFGSGWPFSMTQIYKLLDQTMFSCERTKEALFMPPLQYAPVLKFARIFEGIGKTVLPITAGVHMVEAKKKVYAKVDRGHAARNKPSNGFVPSPVAQREICD